MSLPPKVFISYSHDSDIHSERMLDLADRLRGAGVEDQSVRAGAGGGWPVWCELQIEAADFVLMVRTETGYDDLDRRLTHQPWVTRPVLGTGRQLAARSRRSGGGLNKPSLNASISFGSHKDCGSVAFPTEVP